MFATLKHFRGPSRTYYLQQCHASTTAKTAVLMLNMGDSSHTEDVEGFLRRLFTDDDIMSLPMQSILGPLIAKQRAPKLIAKYKEIKGLMGLPQWSELQARQMTDILNDISPETAPHKFFLGFRYTSPLTEDALEQIESEGVKRVVAFSQYPQYSCCTTGSSLNAIFRFYNQRKKSSNAHWSFLDRWPTHDAITQAYASIIKEELKKFPEEVRDHVVILFSAHSLPVKNLKSGFRTSAASLKFCQPWG